MRLVALVSCAMVAACAATERDRLIADIEAQADAANEAAQSCEVPSNLELIESADPASPSSYRCRPIESHEGL